MKETKIFLFVSILLLLLSIFLGYKWYFAEQRYNEIKPTVVERRQLLNVQGNELAEKEKIISEQKKIIDKLAMTSYEAYTRAEFLYAYKIYSDQNKETVNEYDLEKALEKKDQALQDYTAVLESLGYERGINTIKEKIDTQKPGYRDMLEKMDVYKKLR